MGQEQCAAELGFSCHSVTGHGEVCFGVMVGEATTPDRFPFFSLLHSEKRAGLAI